MNKMFMIVIACAALILTACGGKDGTGATGPS